MANETQSVETLSSDVLALCALLARIMRRCLVERDARIMALLSLPSTSIAYGSEVKHEQAA
jgi:hypothetical protein